MSGARSERSALVTRRSSALKNSVWSHFPEALFNILIGGLYGFLARPLTWRFGPFVAAALIYGSVMVWVAFVWILRERRILIFPEDAFARQEIEAEWSGKRRNLLYFACVVFFAMGAIFFYGGIGATDNAAFFGFIGRFQMLLAALLAWSIPNVPESEQRSRRHWFWWMLAVGSGLFAVYKGASTSFLGFAIGYALCAGAGLYLSRRLMKGYGEPIASILTIRMSGVALIVAVFALWFGGQPQLPDLQLAHLHTTGNVLIFERFLVGPLATLELPYNATLLWVLWGVAVGTTLFWMFAFRFRIVRSWGVGSYPAIITPVQLCLMVSAGVWLDMADFPDHFAFCFAGVLLGMICFYRGVFFVQRKVNEDSPGGIDLRGRHAEENSLSQWGFGSTISNVCEPASGVVTMVSDALEFDVPCETCNSSPCSCPYGGYGGPG